MTISIINNTKHKSVDAVVVVVVVVVTSNEFVYKFMRKKIIWSRRKGKKKLGMKSDQDN